jgi:16S rRNA (cytosine967-C5)-methyltransferase
MGIVRITSGILRGRSVQTPSGRGTRPLLTRLRKSLADVLRPRLPGAQVLDLFAGSGAIAFELISNGAAGAVAVERDPATAKLIRRNAQALGLAVEVMVGDALAAVPRLAAQTRTFDLILVAPPYGLDLQQRALHALEGHGVLAPGGLVVVQRETREPQPETGGQLRLVRQRTYGRTVFDFYERAEARAPPEKIPAWGWWNRPGRQLRLDHGPRLLQRAGPLEKLVFCGGPPLDRALDRYQRQNPKMGSTDRRVVATALYALARNRELYRRALGDEAPGSGCFLMLALHDDQGYGGSSESAPDRISKASRWQGDLERVISLRSAWLRILEKAWDESVPGWDRGVLDALENLFSVPGWWLQNGPWRTVGETVLELARLKTPQDLILRVQAHRSDRDEILGAFAGLGISAAPTPRSPWGIRIEGRQDLRAIPLYRDGRVEVQDEGSQLVVWVCDPKPGERVLDLCAGGGGKALALASATQGRAQVIAHDVEPRRLEPLRIRARRAGLRDIRAVPDAAEVERLGPYDLVLADVPCTSSGTLRRNPDLAWRWREQDLDRLTRLQAEILERAAKLVRPGGRLVYATCSLLEPENTAQCRVFAARHPGFSLNAPEDPEGEGPLRSVPGVRSGVFRLAADLPNYDGDAFFVARFRRTG